MATYQTRNGQTRAIIRLKGQKTVSKTFPTKAKARAWATKTEASMLEGEFVAVSKMTVRQLFTKFRDEVAGDRWSILRIDMLLREGDFADMPANQCEDGLSAWVDRRVKEVKPNTVLRESALMGGIFRHAMKRWKLKCRQNPMRLVDKPAKGKSRKRRVQDRELAMLWNHFGVSPPRRKRDYVPYMFEFACETGMRLGELCRLRWEDIHLEERWAYVLPSKNGDERHAVLTVRAVELLKLLPRSEDRVFPVNAGSLGTEFRVGVKATDIKDLHFHDSRHEATSRLCKWLSVMELAAVIGHRDLKSLLTYYNPTAAELAAKLPGSGASRPQHLQLTT